MFPENLNIEELLKTLSAQQAKLTKQHKTIEDTFKPEVLKKLSEETRAKNKYKLDKTATDLRSVTQLIASLSAS